MQSTPQWPPPGHFYSPIPDLDDVRRRYNELFNVTPSAIPGIDLRPDEQLQLLPKLAAFASELPFGELPTERCRYGFANGVFEHGDGTILYCMLRHLAPRRYIEIGSGWSSVLALDARDAAPELAALECTLIEPYPDRLNNLLRPGDLETVRMVRQPLAQAIPELRRLEPGDVLFIDSTHVGKIGSDVLMLIHQVLPTLSAGVNVHIHDIFYPFEYPPEWLFEGRAWNEAYLLRAYLAFNTKISITWFSSYLATFHRDTVAGMIPTWGVNTGGSIWLRTL